MIGNRLALLLIADMCGGNVISQSPQPSRSPHPIMVHVRDPSRRRRQLFAMLPTPCLHLRWRSCRAGDAYSGHWPQAAICRTGRLCRKSPAAITLMARATSAGSPPNWRIRLRVSNKANATAQMMAMIL
jgi:hypothetical protein